MRSSVGWVIVILFSGALIGGFFLLKSATSGASPEFGFASSTISFETSTSGVEQVAPVPPPTVPEGLKEYRSDDYHFSVYYPGDIPPQESREHGFVINVTFQKKEGEPGFQIYAAPINETTITEEQFMRDAPSGVRKDEKEASVGGTPGIAFYGFDPRIGQTYEVWFIKDSLLYEAVTYKQLEPWLSEILTTWRFI